jgi:hypothetical protein
VLPDIVERTGVSRDFYFLGQWFPKIARLERDGTWAHFPFHAQAEFYADFGDHDVTLDVPEAMLVGAIPAPAAHLSVETIRPLEDEEEEDLGRRPSTGATSTLGHPRRCARSS